MIKGADGSIGQRQCGHGRKQGVRRFLIPRPSDCGCHQERRNDDRSPLRLIAEVVLVMRVPRFEPAEECGGGGSDGQMSLESPFAQILFPCDAFGSVAGASQPMRGVRRFWKQQIVAIFIAPKKRRNQTEISRNAEQERREDGWPHHDIRSGEAAIRRVCVRHRARGNKTR